MIKQLAHLCIHTDSLDKTSHFYCDVLELEKGFDFERNGSLFGYYLKLGVNTFIEVFQNAKPSDVVGNINHMAIEVDDIDQVIAALRNNGFEATDKKLGADHSWQSWTTDPNGVRIEFHQYTTESMQLTGGVCIVNW
jgi:catechol 2,3-dioxygenase-like lactoylglutathione lyase family enzyme